MRRSHASPAAAPQSRRPAPPESPTICHESAAFERNRFVWKPVCVSRLPLRELHPGSLHRRAECAQGRLPAGCGCRGLPEHVGRVAGHLPTGGHGIRLAWSAASGQRADCRADRSRAGRGQAVHRRAVRSLKTRKVPVSTPEHIEGERFETWQRMEIFWVFLPPRRPRHSPLQPTRRLASPPRRARLASPARPRRRRLRRQPICARLRPCVTRNSNSRYQPRCLCELMC